MNIEETDLPRILGWVVEETGLKHFQVEQTAGLLLGGCTIPFIARYRKERTGELDEVGVRIIRERLEYFAELEARRKTVVASVAGQGGLTPELRARIEGTRKKTELEDLYLPYRPRRRTKAAIARERGLDPLADIILEQKPGSGEPLTLALPFVNPERDVHDAGAALEGAGHIIAERFAEDADIRGAVRRLTAARGVFCSKVVASRKDEVTKFEMYYDYREPLRDIPSHRMLAMRRGEKEEVLLLWIEAPVEEILEAVRRRVVRRGSPFREFLERTVDDSYRRLMASSIEGELRLEAREKAEQKAIAVFAENLRNLLLAPPAGGRRVLGIDPGYRTGCKGAVVDGTGKLLAHATIYPHTGAAGAAAARRELLQHIEAHKVEMIAVGNGTAGRETERFVRDLLAEARLHLPVVMVSEAGASVYSASDIAREEFPDLDLTLRGAVSIARRLQDPLAELVKVDPKSIGVGQYQHDVSPGELGKGLDAVVESCVNFVGVDLNTASGPLLSYVAGVGSTLARGIVRYRDENGRFSSRRELLKVPPASSSRRPAF